jgi:hypothetical protein
MGIQRIEAARIIALLLTDGGITKTHYDRPRSWRIHFTSKENFLLNDFKNNINSIFGDQKFWYAKPKNARMIYLNNSDIAEYFLNLTNSYRTKQCDSNPICPRLKGQKYGPCLICNPIKFKRLQYPSIDIPEIQEKIIPEFLKYYFSVEGTVTDRIQISQRHPTLLSQIKKMLKMLKISSSLKVYKVKNNRYEWFLRIYKKDLKNFHDNVSFLPVKISKSSIIKPIRLKNLIRA